MKSAGRQAFENDTHSAQGRSEEELREGAVEANLPRDRQVGDETFVASYNQVVNGRHLTYTGPGQQSDGAYYIGDFISQVQTSE